MSERGKYFKLPEGYVPPKITVKESIPQGPKNTPQDHNTPATAPTISADANDLNRPSKEIEETRKKTGCGTIAAIAMSMAASGAIGTTGYLYITKQPPFDQQESVDTSAQTNSTPSATASEDKSANLEVPEKIYSNQDLKQALQAQKISALPEDFAFETSRPELQAKAIFLTPQTDTANDATGNKYKWQPVRERITRVTSTELLVAMKIVNANISVNDAYGLIVPEGLSYRARTVDATDPSIIYFYYTCEDKKQDAILAQIGIKDPTNHRKLMWAKSFFIPSCEKKDL